MISVSVYIMARYGNTKGQKRVGSGLDKAGDGQLVGRLTGDPLVYRWFWADPAGTPHSSSPRIVVPFPDLHLLTTASTTLPPVRTTVSFASLVLLLIYQAIRCCIIFTTYNYK